MLYDLRKNEIVRGVHSREGALSPRPPSAREHSPRRQKKRREAWATLLSAKRCPLQEELRLRTARYEEVCRMLGEEAKLRISHEVDKQSPR